MSFSLFCALAEAVARLPHTEQFASILDLWVLPRSLVPMGIQYVSATYYNYIWPTWLAALVYSAYLIIFSAVMLLHINKLGARYGFLDGTSRRDGIPDIRLTSTMVTYISNANFETKLLICGEGRTSIDRDYTAYLWVPNCISTL